MADPEVDHRFVEDSNGRTDILRSPFFDPYPSWDLTVDGYIYRILYQLAQSVEEHIQPGRWVIVNRRPPPPPQVPSPSLRIVCAFYLVVISIIVWFFFSRQS